MGNIRNVIFDLGNVIIDLDFTAAYAAFASLSGLSIHGVKQKIIGFTQFNHYEKGLISSAEFREQIRGLFQVEASDEAVDKAWCAILGGIPVERLNLLQKLKDTYRTFALSNTNDIHATKFNSIAEQSLGGTVSFNEYFEKVYLSHEMKMRKPDQEIYQTVLEDSNLKPHETLFIDDNLDNIRGASSLGIQTVHLTDPAQLISVFDGVQ